MRKEHMMRKYNMNSEVPYHLSGEIVAVSVPGITENCGERVTSSKI